MSDPDIIAIGASTGGIHAISKFLQALPPDMDRPIAITQHLPHEFMPIFVRQLETCSGRPTSLARPAMEVRRGTIYVAPGDSHLLFSRSDTGLSLDLSKAPAPSGCCPSVDPMLESAAHACDGNAIGVILSGMGRDGAIGAASLVRAGGMIVAQDPDSSAVWGMPGAVSRAGLADATLPPEALARHICRHRLREAAA